ncbi:hypothetical protein H9I48_04515 [Wolbachia pipientis]|uniref:hypothetical protein n=1 Tax=Wolbachia pipientis TaxID=955 RepID=UPI001651686C|nr:hypothetical protein [Wolbachia pipientis]MBC6686477.1 hypothetical protein [Wolbachia pipientis]
MMVCGGMTVKQFVIPQRDLLLAPRRYDGSRWHDVGLLSSRYVLAGSSLLLPTNINVCCIALNGITFA